MNGDIGTLEPAALQVGTFSEFLAAYAHLGLDAAAMLREYDHLRTLTTLKSEHYTVSIDKRPQHGFGYSRPSREWWTRPISITFTR
jgi:hypothetical protein